jgi:hypothetical protein
MFLVDFSLSAIHATPHRRGADAGDIAGRHQ